MYSNSRSTNNPDGTAQHQLHNPNTAALQQCLNTYMHACVRTYNAMTVSLKPSKQVNTYDVIVQQLGKVG